MPPEAQLCFALYSASHAMTRLYKPMLDKMGLTYPQYLVMLALWEMPPGAETSADPTGATSDEAISRERGPKDTALGQTVGQLGARLHLESNTLTPLLKRLEAAGLIHRQRDPQDERQVRILPSAAGEKLREEAALIPACVRAAGGLDLAAVHRLQAEISALRDRLDGASAAP